MSMYDDESYFYPVIHDRAENISTKCPRKLVELLKVLNEFENMKQSKALNLLNIHRNTLNYWLHKSKSIRELLYHPNIIEEKGIRKGKKLNLTKYGRRVVEEIIKEEHRRSLPTQRQATLFSHEGDKIPFIECSGMPIEKVEEMYPSVPIFFGGTGLILARPATNTILKVYCGMITGYTRLSVIFNKLEKSIEELHGGIRRQSWTLRLSGIISPVEREMKYILGISSNTLSELVRSTHLKYKAYLGWAIETRDDVTYIIGGLLGHLLESIAYLSYIPENHVFATMVGNGNVELKKRRIYFTNVPETDHFHIGPKYIGADKEFIEQNTITTATPHLYISEMDKLGYTYSVMPANIKRYKEVLEMNESKFAKFLASLRPPLLFISTILDEEILDNEMRMLSIRANIAKIPLTPMLMLYLIETYSSLVFTRD